MSLSEFLTTQDTNNGVGFDDDTDQQDFNDAILRHVDHEAQVDRLINGVSLNPTSVMASLKDNERELYHQEQQQTQRPVQPGGQFGLDPRADVTFIPDTPLIYSQRTHDHIRLCNRTMPPKHVFEVFITRALSRVK
jgi:hypothetical protein